MAVVVVSVGTELVDVLLSDEVVSSGTVLVSGTEEVGVIVLFKIVLVSTVELVGVIFTDEEGFDGLKILSRNAYTP